MQNITLFNTNVSDNLTLNDKEITQEEVVEACIFTDLHHDILKMPQQYSSAIDSLGGNISGGQRQRLALTQAILRKPEIFILDEPTSDLDHKSAKKIWALLSKLDPNSTLIAITHDLKHLDLFDKIVLMKHGEIKMIIEKPQVITKRAILSQL